MFLSVTLTIHPHNCPRFLNLVILFEWYQDILFILEYHLSLRSSCFVSLDYRLPESSPPQTTPYSSFSSPKNPEPFIIGDVNKRLADGLTYQLPSSVIHSFS